MIKDTVICRCTKCSSQHIVKNGNKKGKQQCVGKKSGETPHVERWNNTISPDP